MKLLRLSTADDNCVFDARFNEDIILKANSKIALQNISFDTINTILIVNALNNTIDFQLTAANPKTITLKEETYTSVNFQDLFDDITNKMNGALSLVGKQIGTQYLAGVNSDGKVSIAYKRGPYKWVASLYNQTANITTTAEGIIDQTQANTTATTNKYYMGTKFIKGCGIWRARLLKLVDNTSGNADNGFEMGLSKNPPSEWSTSDTMTDEQRFYSISVQRPAEFYQFRNTGGVIAAAGIKPETVGVAYPSNNDVIEISLNNGKIEGRVYQNTGGIALLFSVDYDITDDLYPYIIFNGNNDYVRLDRLKQSADPFELTLSNHLETADNFDESILGAKPPQPISTSTTNTFNMSADLAQYFNFNNLNNTIAGVDADFLANNIFAKTIYNDSFTIISDSIQLESFDDSVGGRLNILATIPKSDASGVVVYEPAEKYFIDISNNKEMILRDARFRVLNNDLSPITVSGLSIMTLLIN